MKPSADCYEIIQKWESLSLKAYPDPGSRSGMPVTIGFGSTMYEDGRRIQLGDVITKSRADDLLQWEVDKKAKSVDKLLKGVKINQSQFDSLVSFSYNVGVGAFQKSTLLKKVKANPNHPSIETEFMKWVKNDGKTMKGLVRRRKAEVELYFK